MTDEAESIESHVDQLENQIRILLFPYDQIGRALFLTRVLSRILYEVADEAERIDAINYAAEMILLIKGW